MVTVAAWKAVGALAAFGSIPMLSANGGKYERTY